jgi:hypothetical protein
MNLSLQAVPRRQIYNFAFPFCLSVFFFLSFSFFLFSFLSFSFSFSFFLSFAMNLSLQAVPRRQIYNFAFTFFLSFFRCEFVASSLFRDDQSFPFSFFIPVFTPVVLLLSPFLMLHFAVCPVAQPTFLRSTCHIPFPSAQRDRQRVSAFG